MSNITVVTTFNKEGMDKYGQRFITSFEDNVDDTIKLLVYAENCFPAITKRSQIFEYQATKELPKLNNFKKRWKDIPKANGIPPDDIKAKRPRDWHKEFKWKAVRFANKVYAVFDAFDKSSLKNISRSEYSEFITIFKIFPVSASKPCEYLFITSSKIRL